MSSSRSALCARQKKEGGSGRRTILAVFVPVFLFILIFLVPRVTFAAPPDSPYTPGETLNPSCSPSGTNCTVTQIYVASTTLNYGISTTSPLARLTVSATSSLSSVDLFRVEAVPSAGATSTALIVTSSGKVGVGTTSPYATFGIEMTTTNPAFVISNNGSSTPALYVGGVNQNGFIGIGTSSPATASDKLTLYGGSFFQSVASTTGPGASDQTGMRTVGTVSIGTSVDSIFVSGRYAYVVDSDSDDLKVIDVSNPNSPQVIGTISVEPSDKNTPPSVFVSGKYAYIITGISSTSKIIIVDVSNPTSPSIVSETSNSFIARSLFVQGRYLYIVHQAGFQIFDISNRTRPTIIGTLSTGSGNVDVFVSGQYAYMIDASDNNLKTIDISNPSSPTVATSTPTGSIPTAIDVSGRYAYVTLFGRSLQIFDITATSTSPLVGSLSSVGVTNIQASESIMVSGRYAYTLDTTDDRLKVVDVSLPSAPQVLASHVIGGNPESIYVSGRYAYVVDSNTDDLKIIDISGIEVQSAIVHSLEAGSLQTRENASIAGLLNVTGSGTFGSGLLVQGPGAFSLASTTSFSGVTALSAGISDTNNSSIVDIANLFHTSTSTSGATLPAAGIGAGLLFSSADASWSATSTSRIASLLTSVSTTSPTSALTFSNKNTTGSLTEFMRLDSSGNLGVGTTSPYAKLSVVGEVVGANFTATSTTATSTFMGGISIASSTFNILNYNGNVGIGTAVPGVPLDIMAAIGAAKITSTIGTNYTRLQIVNTGSTVQFGIEDSIGGMIMTGGLAYAGVLSNQSGNALQFGTSNTARMTISTAGLVGIGTTSPYAKLSVVGEVVGTNFTATSTTATSSFAGGVTLSTLTGNVGIGTTSPWRKLSVTGTVGIEGLTSNNAANAVCILANNEITTAGGASCLGVSSQRFKHDILESNLGLSAVLSMRPVSFRYNQGFGDSGKTEQFGLIAEEAYQIDPRLAVLDAEGLPTTVRYDFLAPILIKAIQELNLKIDTFASSSLASVHSQSSTFSALIDWVGSSIQAVKGVFDSLSSKKITTDEIQVGILCADDICINKDQLKTLLIQSGGSNSMATPASSQSSTSAPEASEESDTPVNDTTPPTITILGNPSTTSSQSSDGYGASNPTSDVEPPVIKLIGNNPAIIEVGTPYLDLGATVEDNVDHNLGVHVTGDQIDTTIPGSYTITYTATDGAGNTATSTREVIVKPIANIPVTPPEEEISTIPEEN